MSTLIFNLVPEAIPAWIYLEDAPSDACSLAFFSRFQLSFSVL